MRAFSCILLAATGCGRFGFEGVPDAPSEPITWRSTSTATIPMTGDLGVTIDEPAGTASGDVLVAVLAMGSTGNSVMPVFQPPVGWTEIRRDDSNDDSTLISYWHAAGAGEPATYAWAFGDMIEGVAWISAYTGVLVDDPIAAQDGTVVADAGPTYAAPSITTEPATMLLVAFAAHDASDNGSTTWQSPAAATPRAQLNNGSTRSGLGVELAMLPAGTTGTIAATASMPQDYALVEIVALQPAR